VAVPGGAIVSTSETILLGVAENTRLLLQQRVSTWVQRVDDSGCDVGEPVEIDLPELVHAQIGDSIRVCEWMSEGLEDGEEVVRPDIPEGLGIIQRREWRVRNEGHGARAHLTLDIEWK
jgi:hypothetical protein